MCNIVVGELFEETESKKERRHFFSVLRSLKFFMNK